MNKKDKFFKIKTAVPIYTKWGMFVRASNYLLSARRLVCIGGLLWLVQASVVRVVEFHMGADEFNTALYPNEHPQRFF